MKQQFINAALAQRLALTGADRRPRLSVEPVFSPLVDQFAPSDCLWREPGNRARLLLEIVQGISRWPAASRCRSSSTSADFSARKGFQRDAARAVVKRCSTSGWIWWSSRRQLRSAAMHGQARDGRTLAAGSLFPGVCREIVARRPHARDGDGGIRRYPVVERVLGNQRVAVAGMAIALAIAPDSCLSGWRAGIRKRAPSLLPSWRNKVLASAGYGGDGEYQLRRLGRASRAAQDRAPALALACQQWQDPRFGNAAIGAGSRGGASEDCYWSAGGRLSLQNSG